MDAEDIVKARIFKIDAEYVRQIKDMGFGVTDFENLVKYRIFKVTPEYLSELRTEGLTKSFSGRTVVREAVKSLVAKGLVYSRPRVGTVVKPRREWHMLDPDVLHWLMQSSPQNEF